MNISHVHKLLVAADEQQHGFLKICSRECDREVQLMAEAGLVEATFDDGQEGSFTTINRVTDSGRAFLRAFKDSPIPPSPRSARKLGTAGEWNLNP